MNIDELVNLFFSDLKQYNITNFRTVEKANLSQTDPVIHKSFSSVITRYFIFCEKHPEVSEIDKRILYYKLKLDMIARYFTNYPDVDVDELRPFQTELCAYKKHKEEMTDDQSSTAAAVSNI